MKRLALLLLALGGARAAHAGTPAKALAQVQADVDGDGKPDQVVVTADAQIAIVGKAARYDVKRAIAKAQVTAGPGAIAATIEGADGAREGIALAVRGDALVELWRGPVGPVGRDGEYEVKLEATPAGLVRYQRRAGVERCDGEPARLFAESWDGKAWKASRPQVAVPDAAPEITATAGAAPVDRSLVYRATAASAQAGATDAGELAAPSALDDGDAATAWRGPLDGRGEFFTFRAKLSGARAQAVRIAHAARGHARIARLAIVGAGKAYWIKVPDGDGPLWAALPEPIASPCVTIVIAGEKAAGADSAIAELGVVSDAELAPGGVEKTLAGEVAAGGTDGVAAARVLAARGAAGAQALIEAIDAHANDEAARRRLIAALIANGDPRAGRPITAAMAAGDVTGGDAELAVAALAAMGPDGEAGLVTLASDANVDASVRVAAARGLGGGSAAAGDALVALAGAGPAELRRAVIDALARRPAPELIARARAASGSKAGDVWRAAILGARGDAAAAATVRAALRDVLARGASYDERYRAIEGLGEGDDADIAAVGAAVKALGDSAEAGALKSVAAGALARNRAAPASANALLVELAGDGDPGVRLAAIGALAGREPAQGGAWVDPTPAAARDATDRVIGTALARDAWPEIRRAAAAALGARCARPGPSASLYAAVDQDADDAVRGDALAALVACHAAGVGDRLWKMTDDERASRGLRLRALDLVVALGEPTSVHALEERFARWRGAAFSDDVALDLAVHAAVALGRLGDRGALQALVDAASEASFPELQAAAATALGELAPCPPAVRQTLDALTTSDQRNVVLAAQRARVKCTR